MNIKNKIKNKNMNKKMNRKQILNVILIVVLALLMANLVTALGAGPSRKIVSFEPGMHEYELRIINNEYKDLKAKVEFRGELAEYASIENNIVVIPKEQNEQTIRYKVNLPDHLKSGPHTLEIVVTELAEEASGVNTLLSLVSKLVVNVPYPEKYLEAKLQISEANANEEVLFNTQLFNLGSEDLNDVYSLIEIFAPDGTKVAEFESEHKHLKASSNGRLTAGWVADVRNGAYQAVVTVNYDGKKIILDQSFNIGSLYVDINSVRVENYYLGGVAKFDTYIYNSWNKMLNNVYAEMSISKDDKVYANIKTAPINIESEQTRKLEAYWNSQGVSTGKYVVDMAVHYANKITQKTFEIDVQQDRIMTGFGTVSGQAISKEEEDNLNISAVLIIAVIALIIFNVYLAIYLKKRKRM